MITRNWTGPPFPPQPGVQNGRPFRRRFIFVMPLLSWEQAISQTETERLSHIHGSAIHGCIADPWMCIFHGHNFSWMYIFMGRAFYFGFP